MSRQVKADEVLGELEITAFATNFRANQRLRSSSFLCEVGRCAIPFDQTQCLMESGAADACFEVQIMLQCHGSLFMSTYDQYLLRAQRFQLCLEPGDSGVLHHPLRLELVELGVQLLRRSLIQRWVVEWIQATVTYRESSHTSAGVPVQNAAGAIPVKHLLNFAVCIRRGIDTRRQ